MVSNLLKTPLFRDREDAYEDIVKNVGLVSLEGARSAAIIELV